MFIFLLCKKFGQARLVWSQRIHIQRLHQKCQLRRYKHQPYAQPLCSSSHPRMDVAHRHIKARGLFACQETPAWHCEFAPISIPFSPRCSSQTPRAKTPLEVASVERDSSKHLQALHGGCTRRIEAALGCTWGRFVINTTCVTAVRFNCLEIRRRGAVCPGHIAREARKPTGLPKHRATLVSSKLI